MTLSGEANVSAASEWRLSLAHGVARAYGRNPKVAAMLVGGSTARGHADRFSDLELGIFWHEPPTDEERREAAEATGGYVHCVYPYDPEEEYWAEDIFLGGLTPDRLTTGLLVEVVHMTVEAMERIMEDVLDHYDPAELKQNLLSVALVGIPLHGEAILERWRAQVAEYPRGLAVAVVKRHAQLDHFWRTEMFIERGNNLMLLYDTYVQVSKKLLYLLLALNRTYYSGFKWADRIVRGMSITPRDFPVRFKRAWQSPPPTTIEELRPIATEFASLLEETYDLIEEQLPEIDVERLRRIFRYYRQPWGEMPPNIMP
ncbi:MAG TPA: hypothetical protein VLQ48_13000 [Chloroflexia bacterium]|nr:hypothetical protein [Chloroflexia bacterium]